MQYLLVWLNGSKEREKGRALVCLFYRQAFVITRLDLQTAWRDHFWRQHSECVFARIWCKGPMTSIRHPPQLQRLQPYKYIQYCSSAKSPFAWWRGLHWVKDCQFNRFLYNIQVHSQFSLDKDLSSRPEVGKVLCWSLSSWHKPLERLLY